MKNFKQYMNEECLPDWAATGAGPETDKNFIDYKIEGTDMKRFKPGDIVVEIKSGVFGTVKSLGDGLNTVTWYCCMNQRRDSKPEELVHHNEY